MKRKSKKTAKKPPKDDGVVVGGDGGDFWESEDAMWASLRKIGQGMMCIDLPNEPRDRNNPAYNP